MIFIDTGGWLSVAVTTDGFHQAGLSCYSTLLEHSIRLFTSNFVLDETITRIRYDYGHTQAVQFCDLYQQAERKGFVTTLWVDPPVVDESLEIFRKYSDQRFFFSDCTSFVLMKHHSLTEAFTFDSHFETLGFIRKPPITLPK